MPDPPDSHPNPGHGEDQSSDRSRHGSRRVIQLIEYHTHVFAALHTTLAQSIERAELLEPVGPRRRYWSQYRSREFDSSQAWPVLYEYLGALEDAIRTIVSKHSHFYWIHLYRRIPFELNLRHEQKPNDPTTTVLVHRIAETAIQRFARVGVAPHDIANASDLDASEILGGLWSGSWPDSAATDLVTTYEALRGSRQWVLVEFTKEDMLDAYRLRGLCYEYWLATARMRAVGKGGGLRVDDSGTPLPARPVALDRLFESFDSRHRAFSASSIGVGFDGTALYGDGSAVGPSYNWPRLSFNKTKDRSLQNVAMPDEFVPNFLLTPLGLVSFAREHAFADSEFAQARGFSVRTLCGVLGALLRREHARGGHSVDSKLISHLSLCQRAYVVASGQEYLDGLLRGAQLISQEWFGITPSATEIERVFDYLTLNTERQADISLWSYGPRYSFIPCGEDVVVDLLGLEIIVRNAFYGVRHREQERGDLFEQRFRDTLEKHGFVPFQREFRKSTGEMRKTDAAVRRGSVLYLCECFSMERPLDFEIGRPGTINKRNVEMRKKIDQALSMEEFLADRRGENYDVRWASHLVSVVVCPYVEWIWSEHPSLWLTESIPRILSVEEAIKLMEGSATG